jgi:hypothetical protein
MSENSLILHCPGMHPETLLPDPAPGVMLLDPGLAAEAGDGLFAPENLPLNPKAARSWLSGAVGFAGNFKNPGDLASMSAAPAEDFYQNTSYSIRGQLLGYGEGKQEDEAPDPAMAAQASLLLAYHAERELLQAMSTGKGLEDAWGRFRGSLGLTDEDNAEAGAAGLSASQPVGLDFGLESVLPWRPVMEAFFVLAPADAVLFVDRPDIIAEWREAGFEIGRPERPDWKEFHEDWPEGLPGLIGVIEAPAGELIALPESTAKKSGPWLEISRRVIVWTP